MPQKGGAEPQHILHLTPKHRGPTTTTTRDADTHTLEGKAFNQVPEDSQSPGEVRFAKKGIEKEDDPPPGSIKAKWAGAMLPWGL